MNNSQILPDESIPEDRITLLRERQVKVVELIETILGVAETEEWKKLKELVYDEELKKLVKSILTVAKAQEISTPSLYRLQGQIAWAEKYIDLDKMVKNYKVELENIKKILNA